jgi:predicted metal-dependent peptidase
MEMTAKQRLERAMYQLSTHKHYQFFGAILMSGDVHIDTRVSTGATDGLNCYYNPEFILSLTEPELRFLLIHEAYAQIVQTCIRVGELEKARPHAYQHGM